MQLYSQWCSSASYRLRIALHLKRVAFEQITIDLSPGRSAQYQPLFTAINPQGLVPSLVLDNGTVLTQSIAIIDYPNEIVPMPPLLPPDAITRAHIRALVQMVTSDMHPLVRPESKATYLDEIAKLRRAGADGVIRGRTEITMLIGQADLDLPVFDTTRIHAEAAIDFATGAGA